MNTKHSLLDAALAYAARGWPVFPLREAGKLPLTANGFHAATTDAATIRTWWQRWPRANIGLPTGAASGLAVIDIDPRHGGDTCFTQLTERHGEPPATPKSNTGGGGTHLLFKHVEGFRNSANTIGPGIDTRGEGGYIVAPPSVHETGVEYVWDFDADPEETPPAVLPDWLHPARAVRFAAAGDPLPDVSSVAIKADGRPVAEGGRNVAAASLAGQHIKAGDSLKDVKAKLDEWNTTNNPPLSDTEVNTTIASVARTHVRNHPGTEIAIETEVLETPPAAPSEPAKVFPAHLLEPPGVIGEICRWINDTAIKPQPELTLGNVLAFFGAVIGRKVRTPSDLRSNLYALGVGESGCGKDHSRKCIKKLCNAAGLTNALLGGEEVSSDSAVLAAVFQRPTILFQFDEIGHMIAQANSKYAASHQKNIAPTFTKLFSSANTTLIGKEYGSGDRERKDIDQPNVCLYGTTVPGRLYEGLTPGEISDGFLGRMLVFQSGDPDPIERDVPPAPPPQSLIESVQGWFGRKDLPNAPGGNIAAVLEHFPTVIEFEDEAQAVMRKFRIECRGHKEDQRAGAGLDALWARAPEHAAKVAMILACGCQYQGAVISGQIADFAIELVRHLVGQLVVAVADSVAGSDYERNLLYVKRLVERAGVGGLSRTRLLTTARRFNAARLDEILTHMVNANEIRRQEKKPKGSGRPGTVYVSNRYPLIS